MNTCSNCNEPVTTRVHCSYYTCSLQLLHVFITVTTVRSEVESYDIGAASRCATDFGRDNPYGTNALDVCDIEEAYPAGEQPADGEK